MRDDRNMRVASKVALVAIALGIACYFVQFGIGLTTEFTEFGYPRRGVPPFVWTTVSLAFSAAYLVSWWFLARSSLNGARLLFIKVATSAFYVIFGLVNKAIVQAFHNWGTMGTVSTAINLVLTAVTVAVFAILVLKNAGRARVFLSMFLANAIISFLSCGLPFFANSIFSSLGDMSTATIVSLRILAALALLISTATWIMVYEESHIPAGCAEGVEGEEATPKRVPLLWRIFIVAIPVLAFTHLSTPGRASALLFFAPAGILGAFVDSNSAFVVLGFGYAVYLAIAAGILWSRTRQALLVLATAWALLLLLNLAGCAAMLNRMHF